MSELTSPLELEKFLNDASRVYILHALDGEIWGASIAAISLFGYSNDEFKQMYLANIKPKKLRLADICKTQKIDESTAIFERANGRRFTARVRTKILRTTERKVTQDLALLELSIINTNIVQFPQTPQINLREATDYVQTYCQELEAPIEKSAQLLLELRSSGLTDEQLALVNKLQREQEGLVFTGRNVTDSLKLALNLLNLDRQPFNIIDLIGEFTSDWSSRIDDISVYVDSAIPELVFGDKNRLQRVCQSLLNRSVVMLAPKQVRIEARAKNQKQAKQHIEFTVHFDHCSIDRQLAKQPSHDFLAQLANNSDVYICKNLLRMMEGAITFEKTSLSAFTATFSICLPEVHDLGLKGNRQFLAGQSVVLIDNTSTLLKQQLLTWGAQLEHFRKIGAALDFIQENTINDDALFIIHFHHASELDLQLIQELINHFGDKTLMIKPEQDTLPTKRALFEIYWPYQPAMLGNVLSQFVHAGFPYPYSNSHRKRARAVAQGAMRVLVVDDSEDTRLIVTNALNKGVYDVDVAVNGIDAVLACAHNQYDVILMDIHLPYMDGFEAVTHLRKVSGLNTDTEIIIITSDTSENAKLMTTQLGVHMLLQKPLSLDILADTIESALSDKTPHTDTAATASTVVGRRSFDAQGLAGDIQHYINTETLQRLEKDTTAQTCREMVDLFIEETLIAIGEVEKSCMSGDWDAVAHHAHSICSSSETFGCEALHDLALQLHGESQKSHFAESMRLIAQLPDIFAKSQQSLYQIIHRDITGK